MARKRDATPKPARPRKTNAFLPKGYEEFLGQLKERIRSAQLRAGLAVNRELIELYWQIGHSIVERQRSDGWGKSIVERLAQDIQSEFPGMSGFSPRNVWRMRAFYLAYTQEVRKLPRPGRMAAKLPRPVAEIPWGHNADLLDKIKDPVEGLWYTRTTVEKGQHRDGGHPRCHHHRESTESRSNATTASTASSSPIAMAHPAIHSVTALLAWCRSPASNACRFRGSSPSPCSSRHDSGQYTKAAILGRRDQLRPATPLLSPHSSAPLVEHRHPVANLLEGNEQRPTCTHSAVPQRHLSQVVLMSSSLRFDGVILIEQIRIRADLTSDACTGV